MIWRGMIGYETFYYVDTKFRGVKFNWWKLDQIFISLQIKTDGRLFVFSGKIKNFPARNSNIYAVIVLQL